MRRERHNFFLCWLFHLTPLRAAHFVDLNWSRLGELRKSSSFLQTRISTYCFFFKSPKSSALPGMTSFTYPVSFPIWGFYCDISDCHIRPARVNTCTQCVHLTNPCTKRKVLSLTKQKDKIYKTKNDNIKKNPSAIILQIERKINQTPFIKSIFILFHSITICISIIRKHFFVLYKWINNLIFELMQKNSWPNQFFFFFFCLILGKC